MSVSTFVRLFLLSSLFFTTTALPTGSQDPDPSAIFHGPVSKSRATQEGWGKKIETVPEIKRFLDFGASHVFREPLFREPLDDPPPSTSLHPTVPDTKTIIVKLPEFEDGPLTKWTILYLEEAGMLKEYFLRAKGSKWTWLEPIVESINQPSHDAIQIAPGKWIGERNSKRLHSPLKYYLPIDGYKYDISSKTKQTVEKMWKNGLSSLD